LFHIAFFESLKKRFNGRKKECLGEVMVLQNYTFRQAYGSSCANLSQIMMMTLLTGTLTDLCKEIFAGNKD
jgi:hypothetical protein